MNVIESGNMVAAEIKTTVRHTGTMSTPGRDILPTGNTVVIEEVSVVKAEEDKIVSWRSYYDMLGVMRQLGIILGPVEA